MAYLFFFFQAEDGIRDADVTGVQTCALPISKLRHRQFFDLASLNEAIAEKVKLHNQTRMQQKDYCREEKFLADEKKHLLKLPRSEERRVGKECRSRWSP